MDKSHSTADDDDREARYDNTFQVGFPPSHVTDSSKRHICSRCSGVLRQPLQTVSLFKKKKNFIFKWFSFSLVFFLCVGETVFSNVPLILSFLELRSSLLYRVPCCPVKEG